MSAPVFSCLLTYLDSATVGDVPKSYEDWVKFIRGLASAAEEDLAREVTVTEQRDELLLEVQAQKTAHALEKASMTEAHGTASAMLRDEMEDAAAVSRNELEADWSELLKRQRERDAAIAEQRLQQQQESDAAIAEQRLQEQRESDAVVIEARLQARLLEEELHLDEDLEAQRSRADALEEQLSSLRAQDLEGKLGAAAEHYESLLVEVEHANIQRIRSLETQLAAERRDHADARQAEEWRARRHEEEIAEALIRSDLAPHTGKLEGRCAARPSGTPRRSGRAREEELTEALVWRDLAPHTGKLEGLCGARPSGLPS